MPSVSIRIKSTGTDGEKRENKISYINPNATNEQLKTFAEKITEIAGNSAPTTTKITEEVLY